MANTPDKGIKNVIIKKDSLGKVTGDNSVVLRFRIISDNQVLKQHLHLNFYPNLS